MTTRMPGIECFSITQTFIHGFLNSMIPVQIHFLSGSTIGGCGLGVPQLCFFQKQMNDGISGHKQLLQWNLI